MTSTRNGQRCTLITASSRALNIPELLNEIFYASFPKSVLPQHSLAEAPLNVSQVSKWWRAVALANPRLWSRLHLSHTLEGESNTRDPSSVLSKISVWLARSDPVPFSLIFKIGGVTDRDSSAVWKTRIGELLTQNSRRWEQLDVNILPRVMHIGQLDTGVEFTHLKKLVLNEHQWTLKHLGVGATYRILNTPKLEYLTLRGDGILLKELIVDCNMSPSVKGITLCHMFLSLAQPHPTSVTNLVLYDVHILLEDLEKFPVFFPLLERFEVTDCQRVNMSWERPELLVVLKNLRVLIVRGNGYFFPMVYITAPHLRSLSLFEDEGEGNILEYPGTISFIARSNPPLEELKFRGIDVECDAFDTLLEMLPKLRELHVIDAPISDHTLQKFISGPIEPGQSSVLSGALCPELETLICNYVTKEGPHDDEHPLISISICLFTILGLLTERKGKLKNVGLPLDNVKLKLIQELCLDILYIEVNVYKVDHPLFLWNSLPM